MIDFFHKGSEVGMVINGFGGALIFVYVILELIFRFTTGVFLFHKLLIGIMIIKQMKNQIPQHWKLDTLSIITVNKKNTNNYECYVSVGSRYMNGLWTNDYIKTNRWGKIVNTNIFDNIKYLDSQNKDKVKQYNRDKNLERIGI